MTPNSLYPKLSYQSGSYVSSYIRKPDLSHVIQMESSNLPRVTVTPFPPPFPPGLANDFFFQGYGRIRFSAGPFDCNSLEFANESSSEWRLRFPLFFGDKWQFNDSDWGRREPLILQRFDLSLEATEKPRFSGLSMRPKFPCGFGFSAWSQPKKRFPPKKISRICLNV